MHGIGASVLHATALCKNPPASHDRWQRSLRRRFSTSPHLISLVDSVTAIIPSLTTLRTRPFRLTGFAADGKNKADFSDRSNPCTKSCRSMQRLPGYYSPPAGRSGVALVVRWWRDAACSSSGTPKTKTATRLRQRLSAHLNFERFLLSSILKVPLRFACCTSVVYGWYCFLGSVLTGSPRRCSRPWAARAYESDAAYFRLRRNGRTKRLAPHKGRRAPAGTGPAAAPYSAHRPRYDSRSAVHPNANAVTATPAPSSPAAPANPRRCHAPLCARTPREYQNAPRH
jgi:hypothetical protein